MRKTVFLLAFAFALTSCGSAKITEIQPTEPVGEVIPTEPWDGTVTELTLAVDHSYSELEMLVNEFNKCEMYNVTIKNYSEPYENSGEKVQLDSEGINKGRLDLEMDIVAGHVPDLVWVEPAEAQKLAAKGAFANLYDFMDSDPNYTRDAFIENYLKACEVNGELNFISDSFMVKTLAIKAKYCTKQDWNLDEFMEVYRKMPAEIELFELGNNNVAGMGFLSNSGTNFVDYKNFTCNFDSQEFIDLLKFCDNFPSVDECDFTNRSTRMDTALLNSMYIASFRDFNNRKKASFGEDDITFVGVPSTDRSGSAFLLGNQFAVMKDSPKKAACWEFIKYVVGEKEQTTVTPENYTALNYDSGIPVLKSEFAKAREEALMQFDEENPEKEIDWGTGNYVTISPMTEADADFYEAFIKSITKTTLQQNDSTINRISSEEENAYYSGNCTAEQCAERIQNRVSLYLSEIS